MTLVPPLLKNESEEMILDDSSEPIDAMQTGDVLSDVLMDPILDRNSSGFESNEFNFEFSDHNYR